MMVNIAEKWREFRQWQQKPHEVAPMSEEWHTCQTCGQMFQGNYCPRCGQSAKIGRYSFKKALLLFLDVWGLGNRGMFRTLRDLILRPGYMIRDYLSGMQMAYFPPFKLFFLLTTLSLLVESGMNLNGVNYFDISREMQRGFNDSFEETSYPEALDESRHAEDVAKTQEYSERLRTATNSFVDYAQKFPNITTLTMLFVLSGFLYIFFRKSPNIPDLRFSELLVALVYTADMFSIYNIVMEFLCLNLWIQGASMLLPLIPLKQMSGFRWWKILLIMILVFVMLIVAITLFGILSMGFLYMVTA